MDSLPSLVKGGFRIGGWEWKDSRIRALLFVWRGSLKFATFTVAFGLESFTLALETNPYVVQIARRGGCHRSNRFAEDLCS